MKLSSMLIIILASTISNCNDSNDSKVLRNNLYGKWSNYATSTSTGNYFEADGKMIRADLLWEFGPANKFVQHYDSTDRFESHFTLEDSTIRVGISAYKIYHLDSMMLKIGWSHIGHISGHENLHYFKRIDSFPWEN